MAPVGDLLTDVTDDQNMTIVDADTPTTTLFTVTDLEAGTEFFFRIRAEDDEGADGEWSGSTPNDSTTGAASATTQTGAPGLPATFAAAPATGDDAVGKITLMWKLPDSDGGSDLTGYEIQIWDASTRTWVAEASMAVDELTYVADTENQGERFIVYTDEDLEPGKGYYYILRAVNGVGPGPWTAFVTAAAGIGVPDAPVLSATAASRKSIDLSWTVPNGNGRTITGYEIERWDPVGGTGNAGVWTDTNLLAERINEPVTEFTDTDGTDPEDDLEPGQEYFYRIRALTGDRRRAYRALGQLRMVLRKTQPPLPPRAMFRLHRQDFAAAEDTDTAGTVNLQWLATGKIIGGSEMSPATVCSAGSATPACGSEIGTPTAAGIDADDSPSTTDSELPLGKTYYYRVAATNDRGYWPVYLPRTLTRSSCCTRLAGHANTYGVPHWALHNPDRVERAERQWHD